MVGMVGLGIGGGSGDFERDLNDNRSRNRGFHASALKDCEFFSFSDTNPYSACNLNMLANVATIRARLAVAY